jgi:hypothetical protein
LFLLEAEAQRCIIARVAAALNPGGRFLFTAPKETLRWVDVLTRRDSRSLGLEEYKSVLGREGLMLAGTDYDEGDNHYYFAEKPADPARMEHRTG